MPTERKKTTVKEVAVMPAKPAVKKKAAVKKSDTTLKKINGTHLDPAAGVAKRKSASAPKKISFQLRFHTSYGQDIFLTGNHPLLGNNVIDKAVPLQYFDNECWMTTLEFNEAACTDAPVVYNYVVRNADGSFHYDWGSDKIFNPAKFKRGETLFADAWNFAGYYENAFYTEPFTQVLLKANHTPVKTASPRTVTHTLKVKSPLLQQGQTLCVLGTGLVFCNWDTTKPLLMSRAADEDYYTLPLNLSGESFPIAYKYGVYDTLTQQLVCYEDGNNRVLHHDAVKQKQTIVNDGFAILPDNTWKGAGVAIPVFSLRTEKSLGIGEFTDLKLLVDWAVKTGLKMIQVLPVNDTTATHSWMDSYPYAAISAFALHPIYLSVEKLMGAKNKKLIQQLQIAREELNEREVVDYEAVIRTKLALISEVYKETGAAVLKTKGYRDYFEQNRHWLESYAAFCYLRDQYGTVDFSKWPAYSNYNAADIDALTAEGSGAYVDIAFHYFVQYQLHLQLKEATEYAHANGVIVKGDIAIGVYRNGADAWQHPELYHMDAQAGAPPDDFAITGQNWGFPTYNWERMKEDGFAWWKQRFEQMSYYFDAFRIDHILGFFRIWSIPMHAVEGIMGHFVPSIPVHVNEFRSRGTWFDYERYTKPFITENVLWEMFGYDNELVKSEFLNYDGFGNYTLKPAFATQRQVEQYFATLEADEHHAKVKQGLYNLISNVILFEAANGDKQQFHFRFGMEGTASFRYLDGFTRQQLQDLYIDYFYRRQDDFWMKEAMQKLPALKRVTNMLVCGEDLGMVPSCVPEVMRQLGLLSLEIQRMPKASNRNYFHPNDAPYLSVVTPSTHDMSTIRGWWEENRERIQEYYHHELGQPGEAPYYCEAWINKAIVVQHLFSPAMWSVFQLQDLLGMDAQQRRENPDDERINIPANPKHYWQYRMHLTIESLLEQPAFNDELHNYIKASGR